MHVFVFDVPGLEEPLRLAGQLMATNFLIKAPTVNEFYRQHHKTEW